MSTMMVAWDADLRVIAMCQYMARVEDDEVVGYYNLEEHELAGGRLRDLWIVDKAIGSGTWPEMLGGQVHQFRVELSGAVRGEGHLVNALVHIASGFRRERTDVMAAIETVTSDAEARGQTAVDVTSILGSRDRPLLLDENGATLDRSKLPVVTLPDVPFTRTKAEAPTDRSIEEPILLSRPSLVDTVAVEARKN